MAIKALDGVKYKRRALPIEAVQFSRGCFQNNCAWLEHAMKDGTVKIKNGRPCLNTKEGVSWANNGDFLVKDEWGKLKWMDEGDFYELYEVA